MLVLASFCAPVMVVRMSLKRELLSIEPDQVSATIAGIISKDRDLSDEEYDHEYFFTDANYPVLSRIPLKPYDLLMKNELAEAQDLPPIDWQQ